MLVAGDNSRGQPVRQLQTPLVEFGWETHIGFGRPSNQDAFWLAPQTLDLSSRGHLVAVADGMGGHKGGGVASSFACQALSGYYREVRWPVGVSDQGRLLRDLVYRIDRRLRRQALADPDLEDMGTTLSCLVVHAGYTIIAHVGDSRIYRLRRGHLSCLTDMHTFVGDMIAEGELTPAQAAQHPLRHMLTQAVGAGEPLEIVHARVDRGRAGDRFLLCTDGLHAVVREEQIAAHLGREAGAAEIAGGLVAQALLRQTRDNVTAMVVKLRSRPRGTGKERAHH